MSGLISPPPFSDSEPVTEILHGVSVTDPYRWLENQDSRRTRNWIASQTRYARTYLDNIPGREQIRKRVQEFLAVETYDSLQKVGTRYFFRKRLPHQEQPCIYMREGAQGEDQLLLDPADRKTGKFTAIRPVRVSSDGRLLLYEVKQGGERTGIFECFDIHDRETLPDVLPRGYLRGFAFAPDNKSFYYVHEPVDGTRPFYRAAYHHRLGAPMSDDREIFCAGVHKELRICLTADATRLGLLVYRFLEKTHIDFYVTPFDSVTTPEPIVKDADYGFSPLLIPGKILAITDRDAPNLRIVEIPVAKSDEAAWIELVPENADRIRGWVVSGERIFVSYVHGVRARIAIFDIAGRKTGVIPVSADQSVRLIGGSDARGDLLLETESLTEPVAIFRYSETTRKQKLWAKKTAPFDSANYGHAQVWYTSKDGTPIPMTLMGLRDVLATGSHPTIMTAYGGHGVSMTPRFSTFVAFLAERGCLFALPNIRGGSEFGAGWHNAAKRQCRQAAFDDFLCAAEWLVETGRTKPAGLAIFGGSNSGLLVGVAMTQRPDLFRAVLCLVPILDMLRYHRFDTADMWREEYGTADDPDDFAALARYSPYHQVLNGRAYPATMIVSGDVDKNCNPLHARKMTARLQTANSSPYPIFLDYSKFRGHSPVLPLSQRIDSLTDRLAFVCDQLHV